LVKTNASMGYMQQGDRLLPRLLLALVTLLLRTTVAPAAPGAMPASMQCSSYKLRRYQPADKPFVIKIFCDNIREEWGELHHGGQYLPNAERYIRSVVDDDSSDLNSVDEVYFAKGGHFWTLTHTTPQEDGSADSATETVVGMCGLEVISETEVELRRMCIDRNHRRNGCGSQIMIPAMLERAKAMDGVRRITLSTPEHGANVIRFYKKNGFVDMLDGDGNPKRDLNIHGTPIHEAFLELVLP